MARGLLELVACVAVVLALGVVLVAVERPEGFLWTEFYNCCHALLSAVVALVALRLSRRLLGPTLTHWALHYLVAFLACMVIGIGLEVVQLVGPGDASYRDLGVDGLGAFAGLSLALSFDEHLRDQWGTSARWGMLVLTFLFLGIASYPFVHNVRLSREQMAAFPNLAGFETTTEAAFVSAKHGAELVRGPPAPEFSLATGRFSGNVLFRGGKKHPKLEISVPPSDWSRARQLAFSVHSPAISPVKLQVRVDTRRGAASVDRSTTSLQIPPGQSRQRLVLERLWGSKRSAVDLSSVLTVTFFLWRPEMDVRLAFDDVRVEF